MNQHSEVNEISQDNYDEMIEDLDPALLTCPHCGHTGTTIHGYYERRVKYDCVLFKLLVQRVKCKFCGRTHAILPDTLIPYSSVPKEDTIEIIAADSAERIDEILTDNTCLDISDVYRIKKNYALHWKERLKSFNLRIDDCDISRICIRLFRRQFMQIRCLLCGSYGQNHTG